MVTPPRDTTNWGANQRAIPPTTRPPPPTGRRKGGHGLTQPPLNKNTPHKGPHPPKKITQNPRPPGKQTIPSLQPPLPRLPKDDPVPTRPANKTSRYQQLPMTKAASGIARHENATRHMECGGRAWSLLDAASPPPTPPPPTTPPTPTPHIARPSAQLKALSFRSAATGANSKMEKNPKTRRNVGA